MTESFLRRRAPHALGALIVGAAIVLISLYQFTAPRETEHWLRTYFALVPAFFAPGAHVYSSPVEMVQPLVGHAFLHGGWLHLGMNMLAFAQVAGPVEQRLGLRGDGGWRFIVLFLGSAIVGALAFLAINPNARGYMVGASGAICGLFAAYFLGARPSWRDALADRDIQRSMIVFLGVNVALMWWVASEGILPIAWEAHLGGFIGGLALFPLLAPKARAHPGPWERTQD